MNKNFCLPLPDPGGLRFSKEIAFHENVILKVESMQFEETLFTFTESSPRKNSKDYYKFANDESRQESTFLSLLQYLTKVQPDKGSVIVIVGGVWYVPQFWLLNELYPYVRFDLWMCSVSTVNLPTCAKKKYGFPTASSYQSYETVHLFSELQPENVTHNKIILQLKPKTASVKFRPPLASPSGFITFFEGQVCGICYGSARSTTSRLYLTNKDCYASRDYNIQLFQEILCHYNSEWRAIKKWSYNGVEGSFDDCYRNFILWEVLGYRAHEKEIKRLWTRVVAVCSGTHSENQRAVGAVPKL